MNPNDISMTQTTFPKSGSEIVAGLAFFGRMLDKIRLHAAGQLPEDYNLGKGLDTRMCRFLNVDYDAVAAKTRLEKDDAAVLDWCFAHGRRPSGDEVLHFNAYLMKRGWRDESSEKIKESKAKRGWSGRDDIQTTFDLQDADEGRK
jgi:gluconokinase